MAERKQLSNSTIKPLFKMKTGLFLCDHVNESLRAEYGDYNNMFALLFPELDFVCYDVCNGEFPEDLGECDVYMATGSRHSVYENLDWIERLKKVVRDIFRKDKYFVGFCFGHQLLAEALGGQVRKSEKGWCIGIHEFKIKSKENWMRPAQDPINLLMMCQDQVVDLPKGGKTVAGNEMCQNGIIQVGQKFLGIQAHPEFTKAYDQLLMENRIDRMGEELVQEGLKSLEKPVHRKVIHDWVINFLRN